MKIRTKIVVLLGISLAAVTVAVAVTASTFLQKVARDDLWEMAKRDAAMTEVSLANFFENQFMVLETVAKDANLGRATGYLTRYDRTKVETAVNPARYTPIEAAIAAQFQRVQSSFDHITQVEAATVDGGYVMFPPGKKAAGYDPRQRPWYKPLWDSTKDALLTPVRVTSEGAMVISLSKRLPNSTADRGGIVSMSVTLKDLSTLVSGVKVGKNGFLVLTQPDGTILSGPPGAAWEGKNWAKDKIPGFENLDLSKGSEVSLTTLGQRWDVHVSTSASLGWVFLSFVDPQEYEQASNTVIVIMLSIAALVFALTFLVAYVVAGRISRPIRHVAERLSELAAADGDLTVHLAVESSDEAGDLTRHFNTFIEKLNHLVGGLKQRSETLIRSYEDLTNSLSENSSSVHEISTSVTLVSGHLEHQRTMVDQSAQQVRSIADGLERIRVSTEASRTSIQNSASAIEEMAGNIQSTAAMSRKGGETTEGLYRDAESGYEAMEDLAVSIASLSQASERISEVVTLISELSSQTNLLAMNAAIEAAHAGDAGKGFAVVAEEIRKLADQSASGARDIGGAVKDIVATIAQNTAQAGRARAGFDTVRRQVSEVKVLTQQIAHAMEEQQHANQEILVSMNSMRTNGEQIAVLADEESRSAVSVRAHLEDLLRLSQEISQAKDEEAEGMEHINTATAHLSAVGQELKAVAEAIRQEFQQFKTN